MDHVTISRSCEQYYTSLRNLLSDVTVSCIVATGGVGAVVMRLGVNIRLFTSYRDYVMLTFVSYW